MGDGAYSRVPQLFAVEDAHAFSLTRFSPRHLPVYAHSAPADTPEFRVDVVGWLQGLRPGTYQRHAVVFSQGKRLPVRLIAVVLPDEKAEALRQLKVSNPGSCFSGSGLRGLCIPHHPAPAAF